MDPTSPIFPSYTLNQLDDLADDDDLDRVTATGWWAWARHGRNHFHAVFVCRRCNRYHHGSVFSDAGKCRYWWVGDEPQPPTKTPQPLAATPLSPFQSVI